MGPESKKHPGHPAEWVSPTTRTPRELIEDVYPNVYLEIDSGQVFWNGVKDNSIPNSILSDHIAMIAPMTQKLPELPFTYKVAVLLLKLRADGKLPTPDEPVEKVKKSRKSPRR